MKEVTTDEITRPVTTAVELVALLRRLGSSGECGAHLHDVVFGHMAVTRWLHGGYAAAAWRLHGGYLHDVVLGRLGPELGGYGAGRYVV